MYLSFFGGAAEMDQSMIKMKPRKRRISARTHSRVMSVLAVFAFAVTVACASPEERVEKYSKEGIEYLAQGELGKANVQFQNALKIDEEHIPSLLGMAHIVEEKQDFQGMFGLLQRIIRLDPNQLEAQVKLGKLYLIGSDETEALEYAEKALALDSENIDALSLKAAVMLKVGDNTGAVELARRVVARDPANPEAVTVLATERTRAGDNAAALVELDAGLAANPEIAVLQLLRIQILTNMGRNDDVRDAYLHLIELFPGETAYRRVYTRDLLNHGIFDEAQSQLEAIAALEPDNMDAKLDVIRVINSNKELGSAVADKKFRSYLAAEPENVQLKFAFVDFLRSADNHAEANRLLETLSQAGAAELMLRAKNQIAREHMRNEEWDKARPLIDEILVQDQQNTDALVKRAGLKIRTEEFDAAIIDLRAALDNSPNLPEALVVMATVFEQKGSISSARAELANAFDASNNAPNIANIFAKFLLRHDDVARAEEVLVKSLASFPGNVINLKLLAGVRLSMQDWRGAEEVAQILENIGDNNTDVDTIKSAAYSGLGEYNRVIEALTTRSDQAPLESRPLSTLVAAYIRTNRAEEAEALLNRIIQADGNDNYTAHILLAQVYGIREDEERATAVLIKATDADPSRPEAYELLYRNYLRTGQNEKALALVSDGLSKAPENVALRVFKAEILLSDKKFEDAFSVYSALIDERPNDPLIANNFVSLSNDLRTDSESIDRALKVADVLKNHDNPAFNDSIGWAHYRAGEFKTALGFLERAEESANGHAEITYHLGAAQLALGDTEQAKINLQNALSAGGSEFRFRSEVRELLGGI